MYALQVRREEDDLAQELRVRVWRALQQFDPGRSSWTARGYEQAVKGYVFRAVSNKIRDYKRDAARERDRLVLNNLEFLHIEDFRGPGLPGPQSAQDWFDALYHFVTRDDVYAAVEPEAIACLNGLSEREHTVAAMLTLGYSREECAAELGCTKASVNETVAALRRKLVDYL